MSGIALITGGQSGIGLGIAQALVQKNWDVVLASEVSADSAAVVAALEKLGHKGSYYQHDLRRVEAIPDLLHRITSERGPISSLINNAGVTARERGDLLELIPSNYDFTLDTNLKGAFFLSQAVARHMLEREASSYRSIVFVTSVSAELVSIERAEYCISKAGAGMMSRLFAARLAADGIGVFELRPGIIETAMTAGVKDKYDAAIEAGLVPAGRWGRPADIGDVVVPLVSGQMAFANGAVIPVDGGLSIHRF